MSISVYEVTKNPNLTIHLDASDTARAVRCTDGSHSIDFVCVQVGSVSVYLSLQQAGDLAQGIAEAVGSTFRLDSSSLGDDMLREATPGEVSLP